MLQVEIGKGKVRMYLGTGAGNPILDLSLGAGLLMASWKGGLGFRGGKFGLFLEMGQQESLCHDRGEAELDF